MLIHSETVFFFSVMVILAETAICGDVIAV
jgi:hypothetical protein